MSNKSYNRNRTNRKRQSLQFNRKNVSANLRNIACQLLKVTIKSVIMQPNEVFTRR